MKNPLLILFLFLVILPFSCQVAEEDTPGGSVDDQAKFIGTWSVSDNPARLNYTVKIVRDPVYEDQVILNNFADAGGSAVARISGSSLVISKQTIGSGYYASGNGILEKSDQLRFTFTLDDGIDAENREALFTR
ncbi:MAG: hypothetical protein P8100_13055 [bacterium]|jgi:hypothetical protein